MISLLLIMLIQCDQIECEFRESNLKFQVLKGMKGTKPEVHVNRWKQNVLNVKTEDEAALDWFVYIHSIN